MFVQDLEGKIIGQSSGYKAADLASLEDGNTLPVGGKEIEVLIIPIFILVTSHFSRVIFCSIDL